MKQYTGISVYRYTGTTVLYPTLVSSPPCYSYCYFLQPLLLLLLLLQLLLQLLLLPLLLLITNFYYYYCVIGQSSSKPGIVCHDTQEMVVIECREGRCGTSVAK